MTDKEIIEALEWHLNDESHCSACPYDEYSVSHYCIDMVIKDALDLISRQQAEIERLEIENRCFADIGKMYSEIKVEAIKEFAERLILVEETTAINCATNEKVVRVSDIVNLVKEMVGDD